MYALALITTVTAWSQSSIGTVVSAENRFFNQPLDPNNQIEIYPNPAADYLIFKIENSTLENIEFELHSIIGNEIRIRPEELSNGRYRISVKDFASGYYFLVVKDEVSRFKKAYKFLKN